MVDLTGRVVLVTGASKGIGAAIVAALGTAGAKVIAHYGSDESGAKAATADIPDDRKLLLSADFNDPASSATLWAQAHAWQGRVDVVVANAAVMTEAALSASDDEWNECWQTALNVNVLSPANLIRHATQSFLAEGGGVIIGLSSWAAQRGASNPDLCAYSASKAAFAAMIKTLARAYSAQNVLSYLVAPGVVSTDMSVRAAQSTIGVEGITKTLAMREWVPPHELAELIAFLATGSIRHLSGATLDVNGASYVR
jgi:NAD(P)-dependent dehydrogenase (short-subunit alcohol dehydrogenase family)